MWHKHDVGGSFAAAARAWLQRARFGRWVHFLVVPLATFDPAAIGAGAVTAALRGIASAFCLLAFGYLLNSVADRWMDLDARKNPLIDEADSSYRRSLAALLLISLALALFAPWPARLATIGMLLFAWVYSMGPRLKRIPLVGSLANLGNFAPLLFVGMHGDAVPPGFGAVAVAFCAILLQNQLIHEAGDATEDRGGGIRTTWLTLGPLWTVVFCSALGLIAAVAAGAAVARPMRLPISVPTWVVFSAALPFLLAQRADDPPAAAQLRLTQRWWAVAFGATLYAAWRWSAFA